MQQGLAMLNGTATGAEDDTGGFSLKDRAKALGIDYQPGMTAKDVNEIAAFNKANSLPLPDTDLQELSAIGVAKESAQKLLPTIQKLEAALPKDNPNISWADIKAQKLLPVNDITLLEQQIPVLAQNFANANPKGRVPKTEIESIGNALSADSALASGVSSGRVTDLINQITNGYKLRLNAYQGTNRGNSAANILGSNADLFSPLSAPQDDPASYLASLKQQGLSRDQAMAAYAAKFGR
jgi:hypothetical protein